MLCALNSVQGDVYELSRHPDNRLTEGGRSNEIADGLCAEELDRVHDGVDLFEKPIEWVVRDQRQPRGLRTNELGLVAYHHIERTLTHHANMERIPLGEHGNPLHRRDCSLH